MFSNGIRQLSLPHSCSHLLRFAHMCPDSFTFNSPSSSSISPHSSNFKKIKKRINDWCQKQISQVWKWRLLNNLLRESRTACNVLKVERPMHQMQDYCGDRCHLILPIIIISGSLDLQHLIHSALTKCLLLYKEVSSCWTTI